MNTTIKIDPTIRLCVTRHNLDPSFQHLDTAKKVQNIFVHLGYDSIFSRILNLFSFCTYHHGVRHQIEEAVLRTDALDATTRYIQHRFPPCRPLLSPTKAHQIRKKICRQNNKGSNKRLWRPRMVPNEHVRDDALRGLATKIWRKLPDAPLNTKYYILSHLRAIMPQQVPPHIHK